MSKKWLISVMATAMVFTLGLSAGCFNNAPSTSTPVDSSSQAEPSISLDKTSATISEYGTLQLNATYANGEGDVEWSSSDSAVASVDANGLVTGISEGTATITATYAGVSATCVITVEKAAEPEMVVSTTNISLNKGDSATVSVSVTVNGQEVEDVEFYWWLEDETLDWSMVASINEDAGKTATFTGIGQGTEKYQVYANVNGYDLVQTITIKVVDNDITFAVPNLDKGAEAYVADLSLAAGEGLVQSIKPEVSVYYKQQLQENFALTFENDNPEVATMAEDGTITVLKEGVATFTANVQIGDSTSTLFIRVNAYRPEFEIGDILIETGRESKALNLGDLQIQGNVNSVKIANGEAFASHADGVVTLDGDKLPVLTAELGADKSFVMETDKAIYVGSADVYTLVLRTKEDFALIGAAAYEADEDVLKWGGYFILGNDIDMEGTGYAAAFSYAQMNAIVDANGITFGAGTNRGDSVSDSRYNGFHGIFDGQGYAIKNIVTNYWGGGLFPVMGGTFKNVSFLNAHLSGKTSLICDDLGGTVENVYVQVKSADAEARVFNNSNAFATTKINNCFVDFPATGTEGVVLARVHDGYDTINGVYVVGANAGVATISVGGGEKNEWASFNSYTDLVAKVDFASWEGDFWTTIDGVPVPHGMDMSEIGNADYTIESPYVSIGSELKVNGKYAKVVLTPSAMRLGITSNGNSIIIPNDQLAIGQQAMILVQNYFNPEVYEELIITIVGTEQFVIGDAENPQGVDLNDTEVAIDLSSIKDNIVGTIAGVKVGNVKGNATYEDGIAKVDLSSLGNIYGKGEIVIEFNVYDDSENLIKVQQVSVPVEGYRVIKTAEQLKNLANYLVMDGVFAYADIRLGADIDAQNAVIGAGGWSDGWSVRFTGTFDGQGHTIYNVNVGTNGGLFACTEPNAVIKNVGFYNVSVSGNGGLIATEHNGTVQNVFVYGKITNGDGQTWAPPSLLVSKNQGTIDSCVVICTDTALNGSHGGMLAGWSNNANRPGTVVNSVAINLSGKAALAVGSSGVANKDTNEQAGGANTVAHGWAEYFAVADEITYDDWAADAINAIIEANKGASVPKTEISLGDSLQINVISPAYVTSYALAEEVAGVSVSESGLITVAEDAAAKTPFTVIVTFIDGTTTELEMTTGMLAVKVDLGYVGDIDARNATVVGDDFTGKVPEGSVAKAVYVNDVAAEFAADGLQVGVSANALKIGENKLVVVFETANAQIEVSMSVIKATMIITTAEEWSNLSTTMTVDNLIEHDKSYGGYYILGADIDMAGANFNCLWNWTETRVWNSRDGGFMGTIDGRGHYVANMKMGPFGLFGIMNTQAVLKNIAFLNLDLDAAGSLLGSMTNGSVQNVYVDLVAARRGANPNGFGLGNPNKAAYGEYNWKNSFINVQSVTADHHNSVDGYGYVLGTAHNGYGSFQNVLMVSNGANVYNALSTENPAYGAGELNVYQTKADMIAADDWSIEGWADFWTLDAQGLPIFKSIKDSALYDVVITNTVLEVVQGGEYQVNVANPANVVYSVADNAFEISASGKITVPAETEAGTKIVVTAMNMISGDTATIEITVTEAVQTIRLDSIGYVGFMNGETFNVNLADYANYTLVSAVCDGANAFATANFADGVLTLDTATIGSTILADKMISVKLTSDEGTVVLEIPFKTVTMTIATSAELDKFATVSEAQPDGYYVVTADIEYTGTYSKGNTQFNGVLDGQGHVINNFSTSTGLIPTYGLYNSGAGNHTDTWLSIRNLVFTNARSSGNGFITNTFGGAIRDVYVSFAADTANTFFVMDNYGCGRLYNCVVEYNKTAEYVTNHLNANYGGYNGLYAINAKNFTKGIGSGAGAADVYQLFNDWSAFAAAGIDFSGWNTNFWTVVDGVVIPKNVTFTAVPNVDAMADTVLVGGVYELPFVSGHIASINEVAGVSLSGSKIVVGTECANEAEIVITFKNITTGDTTTKTITAISSRTVTLETTTDIDVNTANTIDISAAGLVSISSVTANGAIVETTLADGKITLPANVFGNGKTDWENQTITVLGKDADGANVTVNVPVFAYAAVTDLKALEKAGYCETANAVQSVYGYFRLTADFDATGWAGNGTWATLADGSSGFNYKFYGTIDGQGHVVSNYEATTNRGIIVMHYGTIKNLILKNCSVKAGCNSGILATTNEGTIENVVAEIAIYGEGATWCPASFVAKNQSANGILRNNVVILVAGGAGGYQGMLAGYATEANNVTGNVAVNMTSNTIYAIPGTGATATSAGSECANETNKIYDSAEAYIADAGNITQDDWAAASLAKLTSSYLTISGPAAVQVGNSAQYSVNNTRYDAIWSLAEAVEGVSISADGILTVGADVTADSVTIVATNALGASKTMEVVIVSETASVELAATEYDAFKNANATIDVSSVSTEDLALLNVTVGGNVVNATLADGVVTIANDKLALGPTANNVVISVMDSAKMYEISVKVTKISLIIKTAEDFTTHLYNAFKANESVKNTLYGGYYVVDADIDLTGKAYNPYWTWNEARKAAGGWQQRSGGFNGIFDGRGHTLSNFTLNGVAGFFGIVNTAAEIKNLALDNVTLNDSQSLFGNIVNGSFKNIYVNINSSHVGAQPNGWGLGNTNGDAFGEIDWNYTFVEVEALAEDHVDSKWTSIYGGVHYGNYGSLNDCYAITQGVRSHTGLSTKNESYEAKGMAKFWNTAEDMKADTSIDWNAKVAAWNEVAGFEMWVVDNGAPIAKSTLAIRTGAFDGEWVTL